MMIGWIIAAVCLGISAVALYLFWERFEKNLVSMPALLSLFWLGGVAVASLKLSNLSHDHWSILTWCSFLGFYFFFLGGYFLYRFLRKKKAADAGNRSSAETSSGEKTSEVTPSSEAERRKVLGRLLVCMIVMTVVPFAAMCLEWAVLGFLPALVRNTPHAYSYFHVTGVHYFTVSSVMVHPLTLLYLYWDRDRFLALWNSIRKKGDKEAALPLSAHKGTIRLLGWFLVMNLIAISVPVLCVSRYFLIMSMALTLVTFFSLKKQLRPGYLIALLAGCFLVLVPMYVVLTVLRAHSVDYLNTIFDMKDPNTPIFITQPYMYIANNFENFDCLVRELPKFTFGLRQSFPLFALTGLKFVFGDVLVGTLYTTKEELTTLTVIYDAYYDFGVVGVFLFGALLGLFCSFVTDRTLKNHNPLSYLIYAQISMYLVLSFFTTWFSNPTTWFWLILTGFMYLWISLKSLPTDKWFLPKETR